MHYHNHVTICVYVHNKKTDSGLAHLVSTIIYIGYIPLSGLGMDGLITLGVPR